MRKIIFLNFLLLTMFAACSGVSDKELYDTAKEKYYSGNYEETLYNYEKLIQEFPQSKYRAEVLFELGKLYHGQVVKSLTKDQNFTKAIDNYRKVFSEFPNYKDAPNSMFMTGFVYANELSVLDSAEYYYNLFIKKYPDNEMVISAKAELENLGIPAEEILRRKVTKGEGE